MLNQCLLYNTQVNDFSETQISPYWINCHFLLCSSGNGRKHTHLTQVISYIIPEYSMKLKRKKKQCLTSLVAGDALIFKND